MKPPLLLLAAVLAPSLAAATDMTVGFGLPLSATEIVRVGNPGPADASALAIYFSDKKTPDRVTHVYVRIGDVHAAGEWQVRIETDVLLTATTWTPAPNSWNEIRLPTPVELVQKVTHALHFAPVASGEVDFVMVDHNTVMNAFDGDYFSDPEVLAHSVELEGGLGNASPVVVFGLEGEDPWAPTSCAPNERFKVSGVPWFETGAAEVRPGGALFQEIVLSQPLDGDWRALESLTVNLGTGDAGIVEYEFTQVNGSSQKGILDQTKPTSDFSSCIVVPAADWGAHVYRFAIRPVDGSASWRWVGSGERLPACHAVSRAGFGGARTFAVDQEGAFYNRDYVFDIYISAITTWQDLDRDQHCVFDGPEVCFFDAYEHIRYCSHLNTDCDDTRPDVFPGASEICDGIDNDCDALVDADDGTLTVPACAGAWEGVCALSAHVAEQCVEGQWLTCDARSFGPGFSMIDICDGLDNDCDGLTDEALLCPLQKGVCTGASFAICDRTPEYPCGRIEYGGQYEAQEKSCDGLDNDCDGEADEGCEAVRSCGCTGSSPADTTTWVIAAWLTLFLYARERRSRTPSGRSRFHRDA